MNAPGITTRLPLLDLEVQLVERAGLGALLRLGQADRLLDERDQVGAALRHRCRCRSAFRRSRHALAKNAPSTMQPLAHVAWP
jgi:hypothetical protein